LPDLRTAKKNGEKKQEQGALEWKINLTPQKGKLLMSERTARLSGDVWPHSLVLWHLVPAWMLMLC